MIQWPTVAGEFDTLRMILAGRSIARYGDGELKMAFHVVGIKSQEAHEQLSRRLRGILRDSGSCLVGLPNIHGVNASVLSSEQKKEFWHHFTGPRYVQMLADRPYVSSFISRPDSAPWINTAEYWTAVQSLWIGQDVTVVGGSGKSLKPEDLDGAATITHVLCRKQHAWQDYDEILERIGTPKRALICLGPTATVLAVDLCKKGVHAIDLGHIAMFLRKWRRHEPMVVNDADKAHDRELVA